MKNAYRASIDVLNPGAPVPPSRSFFESLPITKKSVETFLEAHRPPHCPKRDVGIFLFEDEKQGRLWAAREKRNLYLVEVEENQILLRADWCWLQRIMDVLKTPNAIDLARSYWAGSATESPVWELIVDSALVSKEVLIPPQERTLLRLHAFGQPT